MRETRRPKGLMRRWLSLSVAMLLVASCGDGGDDDIDPSGESPDASEEDSDPDSDEGDLEPSDASDGETFHFRYAHFFGPTTPQSISIERWADTITERTDGRVTFEFSYQESLLDARDILSGVADGRADMGYIANFYYPSELAFASIAEVPFITSNTGAQMRTFFDLYHENEAFRSEFEANGVHALTFNPITGNILGAPEPLETPEAVEGLQVRAVGKIAAAFEELGANPVALPAPDIYESLQRGVIDAYSSFPLEIVTDLGLHEVGPHLVDTGSGNYIVPATIIGTDLWESLPDDIRQIITEENEAHVDRAMEDLIEVEDSVCETVLEVGGSITLWSDEAVADWQDQIGDRFIDEWRSDVTANFDEAEVDEFLDQYLQKLEEYEAASDYVPGMERCAEQQ